MNILDFCQKKQSMQKLSMLTCYDYTTAQLLAQTQIDCLLVGDSVAMTMHGYKDTTMASLQMMTMHTSAVSRGAPNKFIISDLPFLSYRKSLTKNVEAAQALIQAGANAVKLEGAKGNLKLIRHLVDSGVPVMGHLGLTPQHVHQLGGFRVQAKQENEAQQLLQDALALQAVGCFAVVLECIPASLATQVTQSLTIPTIGIGAGNGTDGQVLVIQDLLGLNPDLTMKFVKKYFNGASEIIQAVNHYIHEVNQSEFPSHENSFEY